MMIGRLLLSLSLVVTCCSSTAAAVADAHADLLVHAPTGSNSLDREAFVQSYRQLQKERSSARGAGDDVSKLRGQRQRGLMTQAEFTKSCIQSLFTSQNRADDLISQTEFVGFLSTAGSGNNKELQFHNLYWTTQVKFVWGICTKRNKNHNAEEVDECLSDLETSAMGGRNSDGKDAEFGFDLGKNNKNADEVRGQIKDMCGDVYDDVLRQGLIVPAAANGADEEEDITNDTGGTGDGTDGDRQDGDGKDGGTNDNDGPPSPTPATTTDSSPVASPTTDSSPVVSPTMDGTDGDTGTAPTPTVASPTSTTDPAPAPAPSSASQCPKVTEPCMNTDNYNACIDLEMEGCQSIDILESCPLQFRCGDPVDPADVPVSSPTVDSAPTSTTTTTTPSPAAAPMTMAEPTIATDGSEYPICGGIQGLSCPSDLVCVYNDINCDPDCGGADCQGECREQVDNGQSLCGGFAGFPCPEGSLCVDAKGDGCSPTCGDADCGGICISTEPTNATPTAPAPAATPVASPVVDPADDSATSPPLSVPGDTTDTSYFDVFFTYRMDLSNGTMTADVVEQELGEDIKRTIATVLDARGISRRRRTTVALSKSNANPIEQVSYADSVCPENDPQNAASCVLIVSLVRVEAETGTEDQASADNAVQSPLRVSMQPISSVFEDEMGVEDVVRVAWIQGGPPGSSVTLSSSGEEGGGMNNAGIVALSVCLTVLLAGGLFAFGKYRRGGEDEKSYQDVEEQELDSANADPSVTMKEIEAGALPKDIEAGEAAPAEGDWAAAGATAAILASNAASREADDISSIAPSSAPSTHEVSENPKKRSFFAGLFFADDNSAAQATGEPIVGPDGKEIAQLSPQGEAIGVSAFDHDDANSSSIMSDVTPIVDSAPSSNRPSPARSIRSASLATGTVTSNASVAKSLASEDSAGGGDSHIAGYTGIAMAAAGGTTAAAAAGADRDNRDRTESYDGSFISEKPSYDEADDSTCRSNVIAGGEAIQVGALKKIDEALSTGDWATVLTTANEIAARDDASVISSIQASSVAGSRDRSMLSQGDAQKAAHLDELMAKGDWNAVGETAAKYEAESVSKQAEAANKSVDASDDASQQTNRSQRSFLDVLFGRNAEVDGGSAAAAGAAAGAATGAATGAAAGAVAAGAAATLASKDADSSKNKDSPDLALAVTQSSEDPSPSSGSSPKDGSPDSACVTNPYLVDHKSSEAMDWAVMSSLDTLAQNNPSENSSSLVSADDRPLMASSSKDSNKSPRKRLPAIGFGSKRSRPDRTSSDFSEDDSPKSSKWKHKLPFGKSKSKKVSSAADSQLALIEDSSVESRSLGSDVPFSGQEEARSSERLSSRPSDLPSDRASAVDEASNVSSFVPTALGGTFAAAALPPANVETSSDMFASSVSASMRDADTTGDARSVASLRDDLDRAIEEGDWQSVEQQAAAMLEAGSSDGSDSLGLGGSSVGNSSIGSSAYASGRSRLSSRGSSRGGSTINDEKINYLESLIEKDDWAGVAEAAGKYKTANVDVEKMADKDKEVAAAVMEAKKWEKIAEEAASKTTAATAGDDTAAADAAQWAIDRSFNQQTVDDSVGTPEGKSEV